MTDDVGDFLTLRDILGQPEDLCQVIIINGKQTTTVHPTKISYCSNGPLTEVHIDGFIQADTSTPAGKKFMDLPLVEEVAPTERTDTTIMED